MPLDLKTVDERLLSARPAKEGKNILTPICRLSFPNLYTARAIDDKDPNAKKKFGCSLLLPPAVTFKALQDSCHNAALAKFGEKYMQITNFKNPFLKAEAYKYEGYEPGWRLLRATCQSKPQVAVKRGGQFFILKEEDTDEVYPGRWCTASLNAFAYENKGNKGVAFGLNNILLLNHDDSLGGRMSAANEFDDVGADYENVAAAGTVESMFA